MKGLLTVGLMGLALTLAAVIAAPAVELDPRAAGPYRRIELLPYVLLVGAVVLGACFWLARNGRFALSNPFVYVSWTYTLPMLVAGSLLYAAVGVSDTPESLVQQPALSYRLTLLYLAIGIAALAVGVMAHPVHRAGLALGARLPSWYWAPAETGWAGIALLAIGTFVQYLNFRTGLIGYQKESTGAFTALLYYVGLTFQMGLFLIWHAIFSSRQVGLRQIALALASMTAMLVVAVMAGSRGFLAACWIIVVLSCIATTPRPSWRQIGFLSAAGLLALALGFTLGTLFRHLKSGTIEPPQSTTRVVEATAPRRTQEPAVSAPAAAAPIGEPAVRTQGLTPSPQNGTTAAPVGAAPPTRVGAGVPTVPATSPDIARFGQRQVTLAEQAGTVGQAVATARAGQGFPVVARAFAARANVLTHVAVLVSQREALRESLPPSLRYSIPLAIATALIPRAIWPNKPVIGDFGAHARLFFRFEGNSFAITPIGDLLLNFGPVGIVPGMMLLGAVLGFAFAALWESAAGSAVRGAIFVVLITQFSMEGFFAPLLPSFMRAGIVAVTAALALRAAVAVARGTKARGAA